MPDIEQKQAPSSETKPQKAPLLLKLRNDLYFTYQSLGNQPCYLIEDPVNADFFQIGIPEYHFIRQLDGTVAVATALAKTPELTDEQAQMIVKLLVGSNLAYTWTEDKRSWQLSSQSQPRKAKKKLSPLSFLVMRLDIGSPDWLLTKLFPWFRWMLGWKFFIVWIFLCITAIYHVVINADRFVESASNLISINNALWLALAWAILKTTHEIFHGLVCKKYGGHVHKCGVLLILFTPLGGYMDATASWRFTSRWQRIHVAVAGIFIELLMASVAAWVWAYSDVGGLSFFAYNIIITATVVSLFFNANPLMKFDGYYILSDLVSVPNLYMSGRAYVKYLRERYFQGLPTPYPLWHTPSKALIIKIHALLALAWRILVISSLVMLASQMMYGAGIIMAVMSISFMIILPVARFFIKSLQDPEGSYIMRRVFLSILVLGVSITLILTQITWSSRLSAPAIIDYADSLIVRTKTTGFVRNILVKQGDFVKAGQVLVELENRELVSEGEDLALQLRLSELKRQQYFNENLLAEYQAESEKIKDLHTKWLEKEEQVNSLILRAPVSGTVVVENFEDLQDAYLSIGAEILTIANPQQMQAKISIPQEDIETFRAHEGKAIQIYRSSAPLQAISTILDEIKPSATLAILDPALTAMAGGSIDVKPRSKNEEDTSDNTAPYEYLTPHFLAEVTLPANTTALIKAGETAKAVLYSAPKTLGQLLKLAFDDFLQRRMERRSGTGN